MSFEFDSSYFRVAKQQVIHLRSTFHSSLKSVSFARCFGTTNTTEESTFDSAATHNPKDSLTQRIKMIFRKALFVLCSSAALVAGQNKDVQMGMQGLMEAGKNPELLAQLFQDMQVSSIASALVCLLHRHQRFSTSWLIACASSLTQNGYFFLTLRRTQK